MIEFPSTDEENEAEDNEHEQVIQPKETDDSIVTFYQKFSAQLQVNDTTGSNHLSNAK